MTWAAVLLTAAGCFGFKLAGWSLPAGVLERPVVRRGATLLPVALLSALVVVQVAATGRALVLDARLAGLAAGALLLWRRAPFLLVVVAGAAATAAVRAL